MSADIIISVVRAIGTGTGTFSIGYDSGIRL